MTKDPTVARTVLPIPTRQPVGLTTYDAKDPNTSFPPIEPLRPPKGAPNVLVMLIDDCGFGAPSAFGGPCATPTADRLAAGGLRFNRFHTTALCAPTRAGAPDWPQPPHRQHGLGHGARHGRPRQQLGDPRLHGAAGEDAPAERLQHGPDRQVP